MSGGERFFSTITAQKNLPTPGILLHLNFPYPHVDERKRERQRKETEEKVRGRR